MAEIGGDSRAGRRRPEMRELRGRPQECTGGASRVARYIPGERSGGEMANAADLKSAGRFPLWVRFPPGAFAR